MNALAAPYREGLTRHELRYQFCADCGHAQTLVRYACAVCSGRQLEWRVASGSAIVEAVTVVARAPSDEFRPLSPYTLVLVRLAAGPCVMGHAAPGVRIGDRVRAGFFLHAGRALLRFEPAGG